MRALITGATGTIGMALIKILQRNNINVAVIIRSNSNKKDRVNIFENIKIIECDLSELNSLNIIEIGKCDWFFHFGWEGTIGSGREDIDLQMKNVFYSIEAVRLAKRLGCKRFIGAGSQAEHGKVNENISTNTLTKPETSYGIAKLCAGYLTRLECEKLGLEHIWTRILSVYGPYDGESTMIVSSIRKILDGIHVSYTKAEQIWDFIYCEDAALALFLCAIRGCNGKTYPIASGRALPLKEYIVSMHNEAKDAHTPGIGEIPYNKNQVMYLCGDISELTYDTGFSPQTEFLDGIRKTIEWCNNTKGEIK